MKFYSLRRHSAVTVGFLLVSGVAEAEGMMIVAAGFDLLFGYWITKQH